VMRTVRRGVIEPGVHRGDVTGTGKVRRRAFENEWSL
ncbi:hypothetical protein A2U01_0076002, partial [Trifolium medium]|nr:hypothetical protein [Trifolium medium]